MTHPDFVDWQQNVATLDKSVNLSNGARNIAAGGVLGPYDVSQLAAVAVNIQPPSSAAGSRWLLVATWFEGGLVVGRQSVTFHDSSSYQITLGNMLWNLPALGSTVQLNAEGPGIGNVSVTVIGYTRAIPDERIDRVAVELGRAILDTGSNSIGGGSTQTFYLPPVRRAYSLRLNAMSPLVQVNLVGVADAAGNTAGKDLGRYVGNNAVQTINDLVAPMIGVEVGLQNTDTVAHPMGLTVFDVS